MSDSSTAVPRYVPNLFHDCHHGGGSQGGAIPVQRKASSSCCGALLDATAVNERHEATAFSCQGCGKPCDRVLSDPVAHWTCMCGEKRSQVMTVPQTGTSASAAPKHLEAGNG
jgi:hypothetical protein